MTGYALIVGFVALAALAVLSRVGTDLRSDFCRVDAGLHRVTVSTCGSRP